MSKYIGGRGTPNVYLEREFHPARGAAFCTGVPAFLGVVGRTVSQEDSLRLFTHWSQFDRFWAPFAAGNSSYLPDAVRGFFENGGEICYVAAMESGSDLAVRDALESLEILNTIDLVCAPDLVASPETMVALQQFVVNHCEQMGDRFAILDPLQGASSDAVRDQWSGIDGINGALYYPWVTVPDRSGHTRSVPPSGHIAGVYARSDRQRGVHKAPANEVLRGVVDLEVHLNNAAQAPLNDQGVNCLRMFPGRGIRVWGARTLSGHRVWSYVSVRRIFLTAVRWIEWNMPDVVFENHDTRLWARIERELTTYFTDAFRSGALQGRTPQEAFYVKCDAVTNPPEVRDLGRVVTEIGLAPANPLEFVIVRLIYGAAGVTISGPVGP